MKKIISILTLAIIIVVFPRCNNDVNSQLTELCGPYLGQTPPGKMAEQFSPPILFEGDGNGCSGFLRGGTVFVFESYIKNSDWRFTPTYISVLKNGFWTKPYLAPFNDYYLYNFTVGPDDHTIYFTSLKSDDKTTYKIGEEANIWSVRLNKTEWAEPVMLGNSINTDTYYENYPAVSNNGTVYFMSRREVGAGRTDVWKSRNDDGRYFPAENLGSPVNTETSDQDPFIAPDESYLILCQVKEEGLGQYDLYIYYKKEDGSWSEGVNMGPNVNSSEYEFRPYVTPDGKYLFFTSNRERDKVGNIFWVDAEIINDLKPKDL